MTTIITAGRFTAGRIVISRGASLALSQDEAFTGLARHLSGDWGDLGKADRKRNDAAVERGGCLFSRYATPSGTKFFVFTEHDRSATTILLPSEH